MVIFLYKMHYLKKKQRSKIYMSTDPMSEVSDALIYMAAIKFNTNHNI